MSIDASSRVFTFPRLTAEQVFPVTWFCVNDKMKGRTLNSPSLCSHETQSEDGLQPLVPES